MLCTIPPLNVVSTGDDYLDEPHFVGDSDRIVVNRVRKSKDRVASRRSIEVWRVPFGSAPARVIAAAAIDSTPVHSSSGTVAWGGPLNGRRKDSIEVLNVESGEFLFSYPSPEGKPLAPEFNHRDRPMQLSCDGGSLLVGQTRMNLSTGAVADYGASGGKVAVDGEKRRLEYCREWESFPIVNWFVIRTGARNLFSRLFGELYIVRDFNSDSFVYCCDKPSLPAYTDENWQLSVDGGDIRPLPPSVRWRLIALIQALPVLIAASHWAWTRRRRSRIPTPATSVRITPHGSRK